MKEIVNRLHENRQIELAKSILESAGYKVSKSPRSLNVEDLGDGIFEGREETTEFDAVFKTLTKEDYWGYAGAEKLPDGSGPYIAHTDAADIIISGDGRHNVLLDVESEDASYLRSFNKNNTEVKDIALDIYIGLNKGKNLATLAKHYDLDRF